MPLGHCMSYDTYNQNIAERRVKSTVDWFVNNKKAVVCEILTQQRY